jgi:hypothetical protein
MTKKDYELIADVISHTKSHYITNNEPVRQKDDLFLATLEVLADELAERLQIDNPRFDFERFMTACGFELSQ